jgi:hypothetical protein
VLCLKLLEEEKEIEKKVQNKSEFGQHRLPMSPLIRLQLLAIASASRTT